MRKSALAILLAFSLHASPVFAEWRLVSQDGFSRIYLEAASPRKAADGVVLARALTDYDPQSPEAAEFNLSQKGLSEIENVAFDCAKDAYRSDGGRWFEGHMATGAIRSEYAAKMEWSKTPRFYAPLLAALCANE